MKLIILLLLSLNVNAQNHTFSYTDTVKFISGTQNLPYYSPYHKEGAVAVGKLDRFDTVKCLLLVCDTTLMLQEKGNRYYDNGVYWQYALDVRKYEDRMWGESEIIAIVPTPIHSYYLDEDKTRFKKSIVIWQAINLKK